MPFLDTAIVIGVFAMIVLLVWSRVMSQTMLDTMREIKEILAEARVEVAEGG